MKDKTSIYYMYLVKTPRVIIKCILSEKGGHFKLKRIEKEVFVSAATCIERVLKLEEQGYHPMNVLFTALDETALQELFGKKYHTHILNNEIKKLKLI